MERSRKLALASMVLLFISQFFQYGAKGQTSIKMDLGRNLTYGGLPYGGESGWELHAWWFYAPLMAFIAYFFYTAPRPVILYWACVALFVLTAFGSGFGSILGGISILIYEYAVYKKIKEGAVGNVSTNNGKTTL
jgi:hypothetical protein